MLHFSHSCSEFMQSLIADRKAFFSVLRTEGLSNEIKVNLNYTHTHTHPFNNPLSRTTWLSRYQKGKPIWILLK